MESMGPEQTAYLKIFGAGVGLVLLADFVLFSVLVLGWMRERPLLARRWSAAHVLIAFQAWMLPTLLFTVIGVVVAALVHPGLGPGAAESAMVRWAVLGGLIVQNVSMVFVVLFTVLVIYDQYWVATGLSLRHWGPRVALGLLAGGVVIPISQTLEWLSIRALHHLPYTALIQRAYQKQWEDLTVLFQGAGGLVLAILIVGIIAPIAEAVFFRGFVYRCFRARWGTAAGIVARAALVAAIH